ncbi:MAG TPA: hypothetical protein VNF50_00415 [Acidimicrobiales bacterium]|nr:hypothetical protein [Acidimicrobiales bacterium]
MAIFFSNPGSITGTLFVMLVLVGLYLVLWKAGEVAKLLQAVFGLGQFTILQLQGRGPGFQKP